MMYKSNYDPKQFDLQDSNWKFISARDGELIARVSDVNILEGVYRDEIIDAAMVTFRGFRLTWLTLFQGEDEIPLSGEEAAELLTKDSCFVFSYYCDAHECELAALAEQSFAMRFSFDSAEISWDAFKERPVCTLIRK